MPAQKPTGWLVVASRVPREMADAIHRIGQEKGLNSSETLRAVIAAGLRAEGNIDWDALAVARIDARGEAMKIMARKFRDVIEDLEGQG